MIYLEFVHHFSELICVLLTGIGVCPLTVTVGALYSKWHPSHQHYHWSQHNNDFYQFSRYLGGAIPDLQPKLDGGDDKTSLLLTNFN